MQIINILDSSNWFLSWGYIVLIVLAVILLLLLIVKLIKKNKFASSKDNQIVNDFINALGGKDNITSLSSRGSRLVVSLVDFNKMDEEYFKSHKEISLIRSSNKITFVLGALSAQIEENYNK